MMKLFGKTNFDFVGWMPKFITMSILLIVIGMGGAVAREMGWFDSAGLFGIDFTGGTSVQVVFNKPTDITNVRKTVAELPDASVSAVASVSAEERDTRFNIDTSYKVDEKTQGSNVETIKALKDKLKQLFGDQLKTYSMDIVSLAALRRPSIRLPP